jgi:hypothetical protein
MENLLTSPTEDLRLTLTRLLQLNQKERKKNEKKKHLKNYELNF